MSKVLLRNITVKLDGETMHTLLNAIAEKSYDLGYMDSQRSKEREPAKVRVSEQRIRELSLKRTRV